MNEREWESVRKLVGDVAQWFAEAGMALQNGGISRSLEERAAQFAPSGFTPFVRMGTRTDGKGTRFTEPAYGICAVSKDEAQEKYKIAVATGILPTQGIEDYPDGKLVFQRIYVATRFAALLYNNAQIRPRSNGTRQKALYRI